MASGFSFPAIRGIDLSAAGFSSFHSRRTIGGDHMTYMAVTGFRNVVAALLVGIPVGMVAAEAMIVARTAEGASLPSLSEPLLWWLMLALPVTGVAIIHSFVLFSIARLLPAPLPRWAIILLAVACSSVFIIVGDTDAAMEPWFVAALAAGGIAYGTLAKVPRGPEREDCR
jgi:hypothetical protein